VYLQEIEHPERGIVQRSSTLTVWERGCEHQLPPFALLRSTMFVPSACLVKRFGFHHQNELKKGSHSPHVWFSGLQGGGAPQGQDGD
jgi:hypothetical protein